MMFKLVRKLLASLLFLSIATTLVAKSEPVDNGSYTTRDKEYYLTSDEIFFIRPGLNIEILEVVIPADRQLEVTYSLKDPGGLPLDIEGIFTPGPVDMRYMLTHIPFAEEQKVKDTEGSRDEDGTLTVLEDGMYKYKFDTILPESYDPDVTHTLALVGRRDLEEFDLDRYVDNEVHNFVPSGLFDPQPRDVITTETCNGRCHDPLAEHGGRYREIEVCTQCHNPGMVGRRDGLSKSFDVIIHQVHKELEDGYTSPLNDCETCHTGGTPTENFPLVANPNPVEVCDMSRLGTTELNWAAVDGAEIRVKTSDGQVFAGSTRAMGSKTTGKWVKNGTWFFLVDKETGDTIQKLKVNTTVLGCVSNAPGTFRGVAGAQHTNWLDHPSRLVCGSCHDDVDFETGENHSLYDLIQPDDESCGNCHTPVSGSEFDWSVKGSHLPLYKSAQFPGTLVKLIDITDTSPGDTPTVTFSLGSKNGKLRPADLNRLRFAISGPNEDFDVYFQENVGTNAVAAGDDWTYTFETPIPMDAKGSYTVSVEGRNTVTIDLGLEESSERDVIEPTLMAFAVTDDVAKPRRTVVDDYKCESCHSNLSLHGGGRKNANYCVTCHMPAATDEEERAPGDLDESIHFKYMIHKIHRGEDLENGFIVAGHNGSINDFSHVEFPGDLRNCNACHVNDSQQLPLPEGLLPTTTPQVFWDPTMPAAAACLSCHDSDSAAFHADSNTSFFGESCATCHGEDKQFAVNKVHAH